MTRHSVCAGFLLLSTAAAADMPALFDRLRNAKPDEQVSFQLTESEINDYMVESLKKTPRPGVDAVKVKFFPDNYASTFTWVDFDAVERWKPGTIPVVLKPVLNGKKSIWVDVRFQAGNGNATFTIEKAYFNDIRIPALAVEKMLQVLASRQPEHYDTSKPVPLPFGLKRVWTKEKLVGGEK
jgi:hypothetical protein